jgi:FAD synthase
MKTFKEFFSESQSKYLILLPGGYKPPTKGHMHMIESYNNDPAVEKVIVLIGPKEREGITREQSLKLFNLYGVQHLKKVTIEDTAFNNPMQAAFEFVENDPRVEQYTGLVFAIGASDKGDDSIRSQKFVKYFENNPEKLRSGVRVAVPKIVKALQTNEQEVSATTLRQAIRDKDLQTIETLIPSGVSAREFLNIFNK